jgi:hypothetical protein
MLTERLVWNLIWNYTSKRQAPNHNWRFVNLNIIWEISSNFNANSLWLGFVGAIHLAVKLGGLKNKHSWQYFHLTNRNRPVLRVLVDLYQKINHRFRHQPVFWMSFPVEFHASFSGQLDCSFVRCQSVVIQKNSHYSKCVVVVIASGLCRVGASSQSCKWPWSRGT